MALIEIRYFQCDGCKKRVPIESNVKSLREKLRRGGWVTKREGAKGTKDYCPSCQRTREHYHINPSTTRTINEQNKQLNEQTADRTALSPKGRNNP